MEKTKKNDEIVELGNTGVIELPKIDITKYIGKTVNIIAVEEHKGTYGYYIKVIGDSLEQIETKDKLIELRPTKIFSLQTDNSGSIGWGSETKLAAFLKKMKVKHYKELIGKKAIVQSQLNNDTEFLTF